MSEQAAPPAANGRQEQVLSTLQRSRSLEALANPLPLVEDFEHNEEEGCVRIGDSSHLLMSRQITDMINQDFGHDRVTRHDVADWLCMGD